MIEVETKICPKCRIEKPKTAFNVLRKVSKNGNRRYKSFCRPCENTRNYKRHGIIRARNRQWLNEYKNEHHCVICGENEPVCLDFHHIKAKPGATNKASFWAQKTYSIEALKKKIEECALICSNCHRKVHLAVELVCRAAGFKPECKSTDFIKTVL